MHWKINIKTVGGAALALLALLLFFSKTIYTHNLPTVTAVSPKNGRLTKQERATGVADWAEVEKHYATLDGVVEEVLVQEGDRVRKGQELVRLTFDWEDAERRLREYANSRAKLSLEIQELNLSIDKTKRYMDNLEEETVELEEISRLDINELNIRIRMARLELQEARKQHDWGEISDLELEKARVSLQTLYLELEKLERELADKEKKALESAEKEEKEKDTGLRDYEGELERYKLSLQAKNLELAAIAIQEEPYKKALEDFETHTVIVAPADGTVISMEIGKGEYIREAQLLFSMGVGEEFYVDCPVPLENGFIKAGDECELSNSSQKVKGTVSRVIPSDQGKMVRVAVRSDEITAGETFEALFKKESETSYTLVPNGALNKDSDGYFLHQIKRRDGIMGPEYYVDRLGVFIGDSDTDNTAVVQGISFFEPVALLSDKPVRKGETVLLSNEGDFFES